MSGVEIFEQTLRLQADALLFASQNLDEKQIERAIAILYNTRGKVVVSGVGKSGLVGAKIAATLASTGTPSFFLHPTEAMHGDLGMLQKGDCMLAISYSGASEELLALLPHIKRLEIPIVAMSCAQNSALASAADAFLSVFVRQESCPLNIAPTSSTTLTMALGDALAGALIQKRGFGKDDFAALHPGGTLGRQLFVRIKDIMRTRNLPLIPPSMPLKDAIVAMSEGRLGSAILVEDNRLCGILSDGDLRRAMMRPDFDFAAPCARYATANPLYSDDCEALAVEILRKIESHKIQLLVMTDSQKHVVGVVHLHDLIEAKIK